MASATRTILRDSYVPELYMNNPVAGNPPVQSALVADPSAPPRKEWYSVTDLVGVPGLPSTPSGVIRRAKIDGWESRARAGRGGGREYRLSSLPAETRASLLLRERREARTTTATAPVTASALAPSAELWSQWERQPQPYREEAERRLQALHAVEELVRLGSPRMDAYALVAGQTGESVSTIRGWARLVKNAPAGDWLPLLTPRWTGRTAYAAYDERIYQWYRDLYLVSTRPSKAVCYRRVQEIAEAHGLAMPSDDTLFRDFDRREDPAVVMIEREGERAAAAMYPYLERDRSGFHAMEALNADGHRLDLAVVWPDGERERATLIAFQDLHSGMIVGWRLAKAETAHGMGITFLDVCDRYGICKHLWVDNTLAMASKKMTAGAKGRRRFRDIEGDPVGVMPALGVTVHFTLPAHGQSKPIERAFGDVATERIAKHPRFAGAYLGNNPVNKPHDYGRREVTVAELESVCEQEILAHNRQLGRRTKVCRGRSFLQAFEESYEANRERIPRITPAQRRLLYLMADRVHVDKRDGCVRLFGNRYWSEALLPFRGREVIVRYHPVERTLHDVVWVYDLRGSLIAEVPCYHAAGFADAAAAEAHNRARKQFVRAKKQHAKAQRQFEASSVAALVPEITPPPMPATDGDVVRVAFGQPTSSLQNIATILPAEPTQEDAQERVSASLAAMSSMFDQHLRAG